MTWIKLDDQFFAHRKVIDLTKDAKLLYLAGLTYCGAQLSDGRVTAGAARMLLATVEANGEAIASLVAAHLWEPLADGGYMVHDYLDHQPSRAEVLQLRAARAQAGAAGGKQSGITRGSKRSKTQANGEANGQAKTKQIKSKSIERDIDEEIEGEGEVDPASGAAPAGPRAPTALRSRASTPKSKASGTVPRWGYRDYFTLRQETLGYPLGKSQYSGETAAVNEVLADYPAATPADLVAFLAYRRTCFGVDQASALLLVRCKEHFGAWWAAGRPATQVQNGGTHANDRPTFPTADERRSDSFAEWGRRARNGSAPGDDPGQPGPDLRLIRAGPAEPAD